MLSRQTQRWVALVCISPARCSMLIKLRDQAKEGNL